jgi:hypothetical protein
MKQGGAPPRKGKRREVAAETKTEAVHPDLSTVTEAECVGGCQQPSSNLCFIITTIMIIIIEAI